MSEWSSVEIIFILFGHESAGWVKYPYAKTIYMISTAWSLTHLFLLYSRQHQLSYILWMQGNWNLVQHHCPKFDQTLIEWNVTNVNSKIAYPPVFIYMYSLMQLPSNDSMSIKRGIFYFVTRVLQDRWWDQSESHSNHVTSSKWADTLKCHTIMFTDTRSCDYSMFGSSSSDLC